MTEDRILDAMTTYGGSFVQQLARLYRAGDPVNRARIRSTWADYWDRYADLAYWADYRKEHGLEPPAREKDDDDGVEYADPRDERDERRQGGDDR